MATTNYKTLGQSAPSATTATALYTVGATKEAVISTITVCNRGTASATYRIAVRVGGASLTNAHYSYFDAAIDAKETVALTLGIAMQATDILEVYASTGDLTFAAFGLEITP